jgi:hypothetical protein
MITNNDFPVITRATMVHTMVRGYTMVFLPTMVHGYTMVFL